MLIYLILCFISGVLETGALLIMLPKCGIVWALFTVLCYQFGNLVPSPLKISHTLCLFLTIIGSGFFLLSTQIIICLPFAILTTTLSLQSVKSETRAQCGNMTKRSVRIAGFVVGITSASLFSGTLLIIGSVFAIFIFLVAIYCDMKHSKTQWMTPQLGRFQIIMLFHQFHYFAYCYALLILAYMHGGWQYSSLLFFVMWVTYTFAPCFLYRGTAYKKYLSYAHFALIPVLLGLYFSSSTVLFVILSASTGFLGTTVFCIAKLEKEHGVYSNENHSAAENLGHIIGTALCLVLYIASNSLRCSVLFSAIFASIVGVLSCSLKTKKDGIPNENKY